MKFSAKELKKLVEDKRRSEQEKARHKRAQLKLFRARNEEAARATELLRARNEEAARATESEKRQAARILRKLKIVVLEQALQGHMSADISNTSWPAQVDALEARGFRCQKRIIRGDPKVKELKRSALKRMSSAYERIQKITESHLEERDSEDEEWPDTRFEKQDLETYLATHFWQVGELKEHLDGLDFGDLPALNEYEGYSNFFAKLFGSKRLITSIFAAKGTKSRRNDFLEKIACILKGVGVFSIEGPDDVEVDVVTWSGRSPTRTIGNDFMYASCMRWLASYASSRFKATIFDRLELLASEGKQTFKITCQNFNDRANIVGPYEVLPIPFGVAPLCDLFKCLGYETSAVTNKARPTTLIVRLEW